MRLVSNTFPVPQLSLVQKENMNKTLHSVALEIGRSSFLGLSQNPQKLRNLTERTGEKKINLT